ncbi:MAG: aminotransferase class I/II-fold pyridoxal phosphate-dependent enzyme [Saprospiraceae bacterium]|nr:aminotransferase class I/II-fold pyridoxal phosphate-dependent enzyme [Saprospiraceae bacterium]
MNKKMHIDTQCVLEYDGKSFSQPHVLPIYATSSFVMESFEHGEAVFTGQKQGQVYGRYGNPTVDEVASKIAALESHGMEKQAFGLMTSSGMSAISTLLQSLLHQGDAILTQEDLYGGTTELFKSVFPAMGIRTFFTDLKDTSAIKQLVEKNPEIKVLYFETPSNPTCSCLDIKKLAEFARTNGLLSVVDNTFCTPMIQQPLQSGVDFVIHSTTKYLNGHGNSIAGVIVGKDEANKPAIWKTLKLMGGTCNPFDAWLVHIGMKTLGLRMEKHSHNAMALATFLENHPKVLKVNYVGLKSHESYEIASSQMRLPGGMLSFEVGGGYESAKKCINHLSLAKYAPTLGDVNTLVLHPRTSSHLNVDPSVSEKNGITQGLIRVSVGIESADDILQDFENALNKI